MPEQILVPEQWSSAPGYEGYYEVSDRGRVRSLDRTVPRKNVGDLPRRGQLLAPFQPDSDNRHLAVSLAMNGQTRRAWVHRLVLAAFVGPCPEGMEGCHNNGDPADNTLGNLRWDTKSNNNFDAVRHGTHFQASKTHCPQGHEYTSENTLIERSGGRRCRTCKRERRRLVSVSAIWTADDVRATARAAEQHESVRGDEVIA